MLPYLSHAALGFRSVLKIPLYLQKGTSLNTTSQIVLKRMALNLCQRPPPMRDQKLSAGWPTVSCAVLAVSGVCLYETRLAHDLIPEAHSIKAGEFAALALGHRSLHTHTCNEYIAFFRGVSI